MRKAMLLAAGRGERMGSESGGLPKPLLSVGGNTLIGRQLEALARAGIRDVVVNVADRGAMLREALGDGSRWGVSIHISDEGPSALETAGGIIKALPLLGAEPFIVASADVVHDFDLSALAVRPGCLGEVVLVRNPTHHPRGDFGLAADGSLTKLPPRLTFAGLALLDPRLFEGFAPGMRPLRDVFRPALERGALTGRFHGGYWVDVGTPARLRVAERLLTRLG